MPNAPALTTATACSSALTGAGATIACGSHPWNGTMAAFTPSPAMSSAKIATRLGRCVTASCARLPPSLKSTGPASACSQIMPIISTTPPDIA